MQLLWFTFGKSLLLYRPNWTSKDPLPFLSALIYWTWIIKPELALIHDVTESQLALDREMAGSRYGRGMENLCPSYFVFFFSCLLTLLMSRKNPVSKASNDSSPMCRDRVWLSLAPLMLLSIQQVMASTFFLAWFFLSHLAGPEPNSKRLWQELQILLWRTWLYFKPCLLVVLSVFFPTLRINPVYLLSRKLTLILLLPRVWVSGLSSTHCLTWQRAIFMWTRFSQGTVA